MRGFEELTGIEGHGTPALLASGFLESTRGAVTASLPPRSCCPVQGRMRGC